MLHLAATLLVAVAAQQCPHRALGQGTHVEGGTRGATCVLAAFRDGCRPADYSLTGLGIGFIAVKSFTVQRVSGRCTVQVISTLNRGGVRGQPEVTFRYCRQLRRVAADVVADRCTRGASTAISLTSFA